MNERLLDLLIEFDEMGFAPTTVCEDAEEYAMKWKERVLEEFRALEAENAALRERLEKTEHRAEVAEKALKIVAYEIPCDDWCPFSQKCNVELNGENWYQCCFDEYLRQAEEKLTEEGKDD